MKQPVRKVIPLNRPVMGDAEIVAGVLGGDPLAGHALVERFSPIIERRVRRLMGDDSEHKDIVQQVFQRLVHTLDKLADPQALEAWVGRMTVNVVRNEFRRRKYRRIVGFSTEQVELTIDEGNAFDRVYLLRGFRILETMTANDRIAFSLRFIEGATLGEVAEIFDCSVATAKRRILRAREIFLKKAGRDPILAPLAREEAP